jgi:haloalkane dehalogenase
LSESNEIIKTFPFHPDYPFRSNFLQISGLNMHYLDEGDQNSPPLLLLHGVPTWSFLYRNMISPCVESGNRVIVPDLIGFGRSEKLTDPHKYNFRQIIDWMVEFIEKMNLKQIVLFGHDWGAIIGLILALDFPDLFSGIVICNGFLLLKENKIPRVFRYWKFFTRYSPFLPIGAIVNMGSSRNLTRTERRGYNIPFNSNKEKAAIRALPSLIPVGGKINNTRLTGEIWEKLRQMKTPLLTVFSNNDPITRGGEIILQRYIPGARFRAHRILEGGHFLQEDAPDELSDIINAFAKSIR